MLMAGLEMPLASLKQLNRQIIELNEIKIILLQIVFFFFLH
jgi:hypothetical protein